MATPRVARHVASTVRILPRHAPRRYLFTTLRRAEEESKPRKTVAPPPESKAPIDDYYALLLEQPLIQPIGHSRPVLTTTDTTPASTPAPAPEPATKIEKGRIIFGSKLVGPGMRQRYIEDLPSMEASGQGTYISGIWIPPKPTEPDNCCMSGCVNCVWDGYREELEEWVARKKGAQASAAAKAREGELGDAARSGDEDGGGSAEDWGLEHAMDDIPVGIREFMKTEKRLQMQRRDVGA